MLVLSRKTGETIQIGENVFVRVVEVKGGRVRLSIDAPKDVRILREELSLRIDDESESKLGDLSRVA